MPGYTVELHRDRDNEASRLYGHGLVCGRFYPYHLGHQRLVAYALGFCEQLTVVVCGREEQSIPVERRAMWIRQLHPTDQLRVIAFDQDAAGLPDDDPCAWAKALRELGEERQLAPWDVIFSGSDDRAELARLLGARAAVYDRRMTPISGAELRAGKAEQARWLDQLVRSDLPAELKSDK